MATKTWKFSGEAKWAKLASPDEKYQKYQVDLYLDDWADFEKSGLQLKVKEDKETGAKFVTFRRPVVSLIKGKPTQWGAPEVVMAADGSSFTGLVGNGSRLTVEVDVYDTVKGPGHRMRKVWVDNLVEYKRPADTEGELELN